MVLPFFGQIPHIRDFSNRSIKLEKIVFCRAQIFVVLQKNRKLAKISSPKVDPSFPISDLFLTHQCPMGVWMFYFIFFVRFMHQVKLSTHCTVFDLHLTSSTLFDTGLEQKHLSPNFFLIDLKLFLTS